MQIILNTYKEYELGDMRCLNPRQLDQQRVHVLERKVDCHSYSAVKDVKAMYRTKHR